MTKLYTVEQHHFAASLPLKIEFEGCGKVLCTSYVNGLHEVIDELKSYDINNSLENLFRIFIDNKATQHLYLFLDDNGEVINSIKISICK